MENKKQNYVIPDMEMVQMDTFENVIRTSGDVEVTIPGMDGATELE